MVMKKEAIDVEFAEIYIHLEVPKLSEAEFFKLSRALEERAASIAKDIYHFPLEIEINVEEGSLKLRWKMLAAVPVIWGMVATYSEVKEQAQIMAEDAQKLADAVTEMVVESVGVGDDKIKYKSVRSKDAQCILDLSKSIEDIKSNNISADRRRALMEIANDRLYKLKKKYIGEEWFNSFTQSLPSDEIPELPNTVYQIPAISRRKRERILGPENEEKRIWIKSKSVKDKKIKRVYRHKMEVR